MSNNNLAGFPAFGPRVDTSITYHPKTIAFDPVEELPTSEPSTPQISFALEAGDCPSFSPYEIPFASGASFASKYRVYTLVGYQNTAATSLYMSMKYKSTAAPAYVPMDVSGRSISAGKFKIVLTDKVMTGLDIGATNEFKVYANGAGVKLLWAKMIIVPLGLGAGIGYKNLSNVKIDVSNTSLIGASNVISTGYGLGVTLREPSGAALARVITANMDALCHPQHPTSALCYCVATDTLWGNEGNSDLYSHYQPYYPTRIAYTPIL